MKFDLSSSIIHLNAIGKIVRLGQQIDSAGACDAAVPAVNAPERVIPNFRAYCFSEHNSSCIVIMSTHGLTFAGIVAGSVVGWVDHPARLFADVALIDVTPSLRIKRDEHHPVLFPIAIVVVGDAVRLFHRTNIEIGRTRYCWTWGRDRFPSSETTDILPTRCFKRDRALVTFDREIFFSSASAATSVR